MFAKNNIYTIFVNFIVFAWYICLVYYVYIPYGNTILNTNLCNITSSERIEYEQGKYINALNITINNETIPGRAYISNNVGGYSFSKFHGTYVYQKNDILNGMPAWFCNSKCNNENLTMDCILDNYDCDQDYCHCLVGTEISNGMYAVILKQQYNDMYTPPQKIGLNIEVFLLPCLILPTLYLILNLRLFTLFENTKINLIEFGIVFLMRTFIIRIALHYFVLVITVGMFVLGIDLSVTMFNGSLNIEFFGILFFICFPFAMYEILRFLMILINNYLGRASSRISFCSDNFFLEFENRLNLAILTIYIPIIILLLLLWNNYGIENHYGVIGFFILCIQTFLQCTCLLLVCIKRYKMRKLNVPNITNSLTVNLIENENDEL